MKTKNYLKDKQQVQADSLQYIRDHPIEVFFHSLRIEITEVRPLI